MATHSSTLAWRILWTREPGGLQSLGLQRVAHDWATNTHTHTHTHTHNLKEHTISLLDAHNLSAKCCTLSSLVLFLCRFSQGVIGGLPQKVYGFFFNPCKVAGLALECERNQILFTYLGQVCKTIRKASKLFKLPLDAAKRTGFSSMENPIIHLLRLWIISSDSWRFLLNLFASSLHKKCREDKKIVSGKINHIPLKYFFYVSI